MQRAELRSALEALLDEFNVESFSRDDARESFDELDASPRFASIERCMDSYFIFVHASADYAVANFLGDHDNWPHRVVDLATGERFYVSLQASLGPQEES